MVQGAPQGTSLGTAKGIIEIDIRSVEQAAQRVLQLSQQISVGLAGIGKGSAAGIQAAMQQAVRAQQVAVNQMLKGQQEAATQTLRSVEQTTQQVTDNIQQAAQKAAQAVQNVQEQSKRTPPAPRQPKPFGQGNPNIPTFAQFGLFPFAGLAGSLGATGLQQGILGASSVLGIAEIGSSRNAIFRLAKQVQGLDGLFGDAADRGVQFARVLGAGPNSIGSALGAVVGAAAPLVLGIGALVLAMNALNAGAEQVQQGVTKAISAFEQFREATSRGATTADIQGRIRQTENQRDTTQQRRDEVQAILDEFNQRVSSAATTPFTVGQLNALNQRISAASLGAITDLTTGGIATNIPGAGGFGAAQGFLRELDQDLVDFSGTLAADKAALESAAIAANDLAEAANRVAEIQQKALESAEGLTNAEIDKRIDDLLDQYSILETVISSNADISEEYAQQLTEQAEEINGTIAVLQGLKSPFRDFRVNLENLPEALKDTGKAIAQLRQEFGRDQARTLQDRQRAAEREEGEFLRNRQRRLEDFQHDQETAETDHARDRARRIEDFDREQAALETKAAEDRSKALEDFNREERRREEDHQIQMARTVRDGRISQLEAAARLDARGLFESQRRTRIQLADQQEDFERERARRQEDFDLQDDDLESNLEEQRQKRREDFERQLADQDRQFALQRQRRAEDFLRQQQQEEADRALRLQRQAQDYALQDQRRLEDLNRRIQQQLQSNETIQGIVEGGLNSIQFLWQYAMNGLVATTQTTAQQVAVGSSGGGGSGGGTSAIRLRTFHGGTSNAPSGLANLQAGEVVLDPSVGGLYRRMLGNNFSQADAARAITGRGRAGGSVNFNGNVVIQGGIGNRTDADVVALVNDGFDEMANDWFERFMTATAADLESMNG